MSIRQWMISKGGVAASAFGLALAAAAAMFAAPTAKAALLLNVGGNIITDNGAGDLDPTSGTINNTSNVGGFGVAITIAESNSPGSSAAGLLQISNLSIENQTGGTGSLTISVSDNNYTAPGGAGPMTLESDMGGTFSKGSAVGNSVTFQSFADPANGQPTSLNGTPLLTFTKATSATTEAFSGSNQAGFTRGAGPYSLTNVTNITLAAGGQVNLSGTTTASAVPEPASLGALALAGLIAARRRR